MTKIDSIINDTSNEIAEYICHSEQGEFEKCTKIARKIVDKLLFDYKKDIVDRIPKEMMLSDSSPLIKQSTPELDFERGYNYCREEIINLLNI